MFRIFIYRQLPPMSMVVSDTALGLAGSAKRGEISRWIRRFVGRD